MSPYEQELWKKYEAAKERLKNIPNNSNEWYAAFRHCEERERLLGNYLEQLEMLAV